MRLLVGGPACVEPEVFRKHLACVLGQWGEFELCPHYVLNGRDAEANAEICDEAGVSYQIVDELEDDGWSHVWTADKLEFVARVKQGYIEAVPGEYDGWWLCDADVLPGPETLLALSAGDEPVVSGCYWTRWDRSALPQPNAWLTYPSGMRGEGMSEREFYRSLAQRQRVEVGGSGACTLFRAEALMFARYHPRMRWLPKTDIWQGEDRTMGLVLEAHGLTQHLDAWPRIYHAYHDEQRTNDWLDAAWDDLWRNRPKLIQEGDWLLHASGVRGPAPERVWGEEIGGEYLDARPFRLAPVLDEVADVDLTAKPS